MPVTVTNTGTILSTGTGSLVNLSSGTINGGTLTTTSGGVMDVGNSTLNGVTISTGSTATVQNGTTVTLTGTLTNNGVLAFSRVAATPFWTSAAPSRTLAAARSRCRTSPTTLSTALAR